MATVLVGDGLKTRTEHYTITSNNTTAVVIYPKFRTILTAYASWLADIGNTGHVLECVISSSGTPRVSVTCSGNIQVKVAVMIVGYP